MHGYFMGYERMIGEPLGFLGFGLDAQVFFYVLLISFITIWSLAWKGLALWHSARNKQVWWFVPVLLINTVGILEIVYLFFFRTDKESVAVIPFTQKRVRRSKKESIE